MAIDKAVDSTKLNGAITATADAIREKTGGTDPITWDESKGFSDAVSGIEAGGGDIENPYIECTYEYGSYYDSAPDGVKFYGFRIIPKVCYDNGGLKTAEFDEQPAVIAHSAFYKCSNLALTSLPSGLTKIENSAFQGCSNLTLTSLPSGLTQIGVGAFSECSNLALTSLPSGLTKIENSVFQGCSNLALTSLPSGLTQIANSVFQGCSNLALTSLPSGLNYLGGSAFMNCSNVAFTSVPEGITTLGSGVFWGCTSLETMLLPNVTSITGTSFWGCTNLTLIDMPKMNSIAASAFNGASSLQTIILGADTLCTLANTNAFKDTPFAAGGTGGTAYVPQALIEDYKNATNWSTLYAAGTCNFVAKEGSEYE